MTVIIRRLKDFHYSMPWGLVPPKLHMVIIWGLILIGPRGYGNMTQGSVVLWSVWVRATTGSL